MNSFFAAISAIRQFVSWGIELAKFVSSWIFRRKLEKQEEETKKAEQELRDANVIQEAKERLSAKEKARNELENSLRSH